MRLVRLVVGVGVCIAGAGRVVSASKPDAPGAGHAEEKARPITLAPADRNAMADRFKREIWPLLKRGKESCVSCHDGTNASSLEFSATSEESFLMLLREGYLSAENPLSLLAKITAPKEKIRMPPPPAAPWADKDVRTLRAFYNDLYGKARRDGPPADESFPAELLEPFSGDSPAAGMDNTFLSFTQLKKKVAMLFDDDWHRDGRDLFRENIHLFGGADFQQRFTESTKASASFLTALETMARDVASYAYLNRTGPFAEWDDAELIAPLGLTKPNAAYRRAIDRLYRHVLFRGATDTEIDEAFRLVQAVHRVGETESREPYVLAFELTVTSPDGLQTTRDFNLPVSAEQLGVYQEYVDQTQPASKDKKVARHELGQSFAFKKDDPDQRVTISNARTHGNVSVIGIELRGPLPAEKAVTILIKDASVQAFGAWRGGDKSYEDGDANKGESRLVIPVRVEADGRYEVALLWQAGERNASSVPVEVYSHDESRLAAPALAAPPPPGEARFFLDQSVDREAFVDLKTAFRFTSDDHYVEISNTATTRLVTADAVKFVPAGDGKPLVVDNPEAENHEQWTVFKSPNFRAYNRVGKNSLSDKDKKKGALWIRYRPSAKKEAFRPDVHYRVTVSFPAKKDHETRTPVIVKAASSSPIVRISYPLRAQRGAHVALDASASYCVQGGALSFRWRQKSGPRVALSDPTQPVLTFRAPIPDATQEAWERLAAALVQHPDFVFTRPPSLAETTDPTERRRLRLVKIAQDLVGRPPTADELRDVEAGVPLASAVDYYLGTQDFEDFYFHRIRLYLESHGSRVQDEPVRLWCYVAFNDRPLTEILDADYTVDAELRPQPRPAAHGHTGLLTMPGFIEGKPGLPHFNYAALVAEKFLGYVFEVPPEIVEQRGAITAASTTNPNTVCYSCHKILTPLAYQRLAWDDQGKHRAKNKDGRAIDDTDRGLVPSYPFKGKGMAAFATAAKKKERFIRTMINAHFIFHFGREMRHAADERGLYKRLWDTLAANGYTFRSLIKGIVTSPEYLSGGISASSATVARLK